MTEWEANAASNCGTRTTKAGISLALGLLANACHAWSKFAAIRFDGIWVSCSRSSRNLDSISDFRLLSCADV